MQGILRHANIQTTLNLYTQEDGDETRAALGGVAALWNENGGNPMKCGLDCGSGFSSHHPISPLE